MHTFHRNPDGSASIVTEGGDRIDIRHIIGIGRNYAAHADEQGADRPEQHRGRQAHQIGHASTGGVGDQAEHHQNGQQRGKPRRRRRRARHDGRPVRS